jgi:hypothetical protein
MRPFDELAAKARDRKAPTFERKSAIHELAKQDDPRLLGLFEQLLDDPEVTVRREAIGALGRARGARATALLVRALDDDDRACVKAALAQLGVRNDPAAAPALERLTEVSDLGTRIEAKRLLAKLGARSGLAEEAEHGAGAEASVEAPPEPAAPVVEETSPPRPPVPPRPERAQAPPAQADQTPRRPPPPPPPPLTGRFPPRPVRVTRLSGSPSDLFGLARKRKEGEQEGCAGSAAKMFALIVVIAAVVLMIGTCVRSLH